MEYFTFTSDISVDHNELQMLQGGTANEYYHLTENQHTNNLIGEYVEEYKSLVVTR